jgi:hypothetical protein
MRTRVGRLWREIAEPPLVEPPEVVAFSPPSPLTDGEIFLRTSSTFVSTPLFWMSEGVMMATGIDSASPAFWMFEPVTTNWVITWGVVSSAGAVSEVVVVVVVVWACRERAAQAPRRAPNMAFGFHNRCMGVTGYVCLKPLHGVERVCFARSKARVGHTSILLRRTVGKIPRINENAGRKNPGRADWRVRVATHRASPGFRRTAAQKRDGRQTPQKSRQT